MPAVVRIGDSLSTGHGCDGTTTLAGANQGSVYCNNILAAVRLAPTVTHLIGPPCAGHVAFLNAGSPNVFFENIPVGRIGDSADAGAMSSGSPDVFAN